MNESRRNASESRTGAGGRAWRVWRVVGRILVVLAAGTSLMVLFLVGGIAVAFHDGLVPLAGVYVPCLAAFCLGLFGMVMGWACGLRRWVRRAGGVVVAAAVGVALAAGVHDWYARTRYPAVGETGRVDWERYRPFAVSNALPRCEAPGEYRFRDGGPALRAAHALYPVAAAAVQALGSPEGYTGSNEWRRLSHGGSDDLFERLYRDDPWGGLRCDAVFGLAPSPEQEGKAAERGVAFVRTAVARDAFVFFVNAANPATNLTSGQIRDIYSGRATAWRDLGIDFGAPLVAYQRNRNSGSQTMLERIMGDVPPAAAPKERRSDGMGGIFSAVADYRNQPGAIGFSFRYYATELVAAGETRLLSIDGVAPTPDNIRSGRYPFIADAYLVTAGERSPDTRRLAEFLVSPEGRALVEAVGYVAPGP
ncbi:MAG: substrate-binding domain-containing protein [Kiritimatiellae bacterium]|nr:substrate-binding domain-containing protein [Kiritimatiellia bacterium]